MSDLVLPQLLVLEDPGDESLCHLVVHLLKRTELLEGSHVADLGRFGLDTAAWVGFCRVHLEVDKRALLGACSLALLDGAAGRGLISEATTRVKQRIDSSLTSRTCLLVLNDVDEVDLDALVGAVAVDALVMHGFMNDRANVVCVDMPLRLLIPEVEEIPDQVVCGDALLTVFLLVTGRALVDTAARRGEGHIHDGRLHSATPLDHAVGHTVTSRDRVLDNSGFWLWPLLLLATFIFTVKPACWAQEGHPPIDVGLMVIAAIGAGRPGSLVALVVLGDQRVLRGYHQLARLLQVAQRVQLLPLLRGHL